MEELNVYEYLPYILILCVIIIIICMYNKRSSCVICLCCRDVEPYIHKIFLNLQRLETLFSTTQIVFFYDKSKDNTLKLLYDYKERFPNIHIIENKEPLLKYRTHRIAYGRNKLLDYMNTHFNNYEYFIMMDCDDVCINPIKTEIIDKYLVRNDWDGLSFNRPFYYDSWALLYEPFIWDYLGYGKYSSTIMYIMIDDITNKLKNMNDNELFPCISAFNGFAIYRKAKFNNIRYDGTRSYKITENQKKELKKYIYETFNLPVDIKDECWEWLDLTKKPELCEHIPFHVNAIKHNQARIRIAKDYLFY
jgi:hypothetical protein